MTFEVLLERACETSHLTRHALVSRSGLSPAGFDELCDGRVDVVFWAEVLAQLAIAFRVPSSRLISESGKHTEAVVGASGACIRRTREARGVSLDLAAAKAGLSTTDYRRIEAGESPLERVGPVLLLCAELLDLPVFNLIDLLLEDVESARDAGSRSC